MRNASVLLLLVAGCGRPFADQVNGVNGNIALYGEMDYSGSDVALVVAFDNGEPGVEDDIAGLLDGVPTEIETPVAHTTTDQMGNYNLKDPPNGNFFVVVTHPGFSPFVRRDRVTISNGSNGKVTLEDIMLTHVTFAAGNAIFSPGGQNYDGTLQLFMVNDLPNIFDTETAKLTPVPRDMPIAGVTMAPTGANALFHSGALGGAENVILGVGQVRAATPGGALAPITVISTNTSLAFVGGDGSHFTMFNPTGNGTNVDIRSGAFAAPAMLTTIGSDVPTNTLEFVTDTNFKPGAFQPTIYKQIAFELNNRDLMIGAGTVPVRDFTMLDVNAGSATTLTQLIGANDTIILSSGDQFRLIKTVKDAGGVPEVDLHLYQLSGMPQKITTTGLRGNSFSLDQTTTPGKGYVFVPNGTDTNLYVFDVSSTPGFQQLATLPGTFFNFNVNTMRRMGDRWLFLDRVGGGVNVSAIDVKTGAKSTVLAGITTATGAAVGGNINSANISRPLAANSFLMTTGANGTTVNFVVLDPAGAHTIGGTWPATSYFGYTASFVPQLSADGGTLLIYDGTAVTGGIITAPIASGTASAPVANTSITAVPAPTTMAISPDGATVGYATRVTAVVTPHTVTGGIDTPRTTWTSATDAVRMVLVQQGLVLFDSGGVNVFATEFNTNTFGTMTAVGGSTFNFADGQRIVISNGGGAGSSRSYEVAFNTNLGNTVLTANVNNLNFYMNGPRNRLLVVSGGGIRALSSDGTADTSITGFNFVPLTVGGNPVPASPNGKVLYIIDGLGRLIAYNETGAPVILANAIANTGTNLKLLSGKTDITYLDTAANNVRTLAVANLDSAVRTDVVKGVVNFGFQPGFGIGPALSIDNKTVFAMGDANAGVAGMKANNQLAAWDVTSKAVIVLANNASLTPAPTVDSKGRTLSFRGDQDSLSGTFTAYSWAIGPSAANTIATKTRALLTSPDGKSNLVITAEGLKTKLAAGPVGMPAVALGDFGCSFLKLGSNVIFSGDGTRVFALAVPSAGVGSGDLVAGTIGSAGLRRIAPQVSYVNPDKTGKMASVFSTTLVPNFGSALGVYRE